MQQGCNSIWYKDKWCGKYCVLCNMPVQHTHAWLERPDMAFATVLSPLCMQGTSQHARVSAKMDKGLVLVSAVPAVLNHAQHLCLYMKGG